MKKISVLLVQCLAVALVAVAGLFNPNILNAQKKIDMSDRFQINKDASYVTFETSYTGFPVIRGSLKAYQATIFYDPENVEATSATIRFGSESISTAHDRRDEVLKSEDFLNVASFPAMWFQGTEVKRTDQGMELTGTMNIKDIQKEVTIHLEKPTVMRRAFNKMDGMIVKGELSINRKDFKIGLNAQQNQMLGDEIKIEFSLMGTSYTLDYLKASYVRKIGGVDHPVGIVYNDIVANGLESGKKRFKALQKKKEYAKADWLGAMSDLGWILMTDGYADEALAFFKLALSQNPDHVSSILRIGDAYVIGGYYKEAAEHFKKIYEGRPRFTHYPHLIKLITGKFELKAMQ